MHSAQQHNPNRTHRLRILTNLLPRIPHPAQDLAPNAAEADLHAQSKLHPLHRLLTLGISFLALRRRPDLPRGREIGSGPAHPIRLSRRDQEPLSGELQAREHGLCESAQLWRWSVQLDAEGADGELRHDGVWEERCAGECQGRD